MPVETRRLEREASADGPPLSRSQNGVNVGLVLFVSQALQVSTVDVFIGAFFVFFGMLAIDDQSRTSWLSNAAGWLRLHLAQQRRVELASELLRVAGGLAAFSGFYFAVAMLTDSTYREEFLAELTEEMGTSFRARIACLRLRAAGSVPV